MAFILPNRLGLCFCNHGSPRIKLHLGCPLPKTKVFLGVTSRFALKMVKYGE